MHIMEGFLPFRHAAAWTVVSAPFIVLGISRLTKRLQKEPETRLVLGASGGFTFVLSALKLPSITGSCSHPTGIGFGTILFGPGIMSVLGLIVLIFQALLLGHGGLTTLGANVFSMSIVGSYTAYFIYKIGCRLNVPFGLAVFFSASISNLSTYVSTSLQLALAFPDPISGVSGSAIKFLSIFALTQIPLAVSEGLLTVLVMNMLKSHAQETVQGLLSFDKKAL